MLVTVLCWFDQGETAKGGGLRFSQQLREYPELLTSRRFWGYVLSAMFASGAGSNLRALAPFIAADQSWRLVDHDADLFAAALERIGAWADRRDATDGGFFKEGRRIDVSFAFVDLANDRRWTVSMTASSPAR